MPTPPHPAVIALLIADSVLFDAVVRKHFIVGTYNTINSTRFPATHDPMAFYLALTNGRGEARLTLQIVDVDNARAPVFRGEIPVRFADPTAVVEVAFRLPHQTVFPEPGEYRIELWAGKDLLHQRRLQVVQIG